VQLYTGLVYGGAALPARIVREMEALMRRDGFAQIAEAIGAG
jgi:dihydroorotate dehydrogenase